MHELMSTLIGQPLDFVEVRLFACNMQTHVRRIDGKDLGTPDGFPNNTDRVVLTAAKGKVVAYELG